MNNELLKQKWDWFRQRNEWLQSIPDAVPVLKPSVRPVGSSGVFSLKLSVLDYSELTDRWFGDRNKTFRANFVEYVSQVFSVLIESVLLPDGTLTTDKGGKQLYAPDLKRISRNYKPFNTVLNNDGLLEIVSLHKKGVKCRCYALDQSVIRKGVEKSFLTDEQKRELIGTLSIDDGPDKTDTNGSQLLGYFVELLRKTTIDTTELDRIEIEVGRFCRLHPSVVRHQTGKFDLKIDPKTQRLDAIYLRAPKEFRKLLRFDGQPFVEGDVAACHFHFFLREMTDPEERKRMESDLVSADPYLSMCGNPVGVSREDLKQSSHTFKYGNRTIRMGPMTDWDWHDFVQYKKGLFYRHIAKRFPKFAFAMSAKPISHKKHRSKFACDVMAEESKVMVYQVGERCQSEGLVYLPVHDGFMTLPDQYDRVCQIVTECFQSETGSVPKIKRK